MVGVRWRELGGGAVEAVRVLDAWWLTRLW
ncbi:hypothetical protein HDA44_000511 [Kribbella solani]|uniref:Uncharacterized protein n=1 Tax=Kribbella solani TaxID=236067 RepID=A0A841DKG4_9ACTN|nr:hypothetical protein [Kribbella solani]